MLTESRKSDIGTAYHQTSHRHRFTSDAWIDSMGTTMASIDIVFNHIFEGKNR
jgi:hypothetical protein